jgi:hypothetical protein
MSPNTVHLFQVLLCLITLIGSMSIVVARIMSLFAALQHCMFNHDLLMISNRG